MHEMVSKTKWSRFHGTRVDWDFVEGISPVSLTISSSFANARELVLSAIHPKASFLALQDRRHVARSY
jgi:hypothetical protein